MSKFKLIENNKERIGFVVDANEQSPQKDLFLRYFDAYKELQQRKSQYTKDMQALTLDMECDGIPFNAFKKAIAMEKKRRENHDLFEREQNVINNFLDLLSEINDLK